MQSETFLDFAGLWFWVSLYGLGLFLAATLIVGLGDVIMWIRRLSWRQRVRQIRLRNRW